MAIKHKVTINVTDEKGNNVKILRGGQLTLPQKIINNEMARQKRTTNRFLADSSELKMIRRTVPVIPDLRLPDAPGTCPP